MSENGERSTEDVEAMDGLGSMGNVGGSGDSGAVECVVGLIIGGKERGIAEFYDDEEGSGSLAEACLEGNGDDCCIVSDAGECGIGFVIGGGKIDWDRKGGSLVEGCSEGDVADGDFCVGSNVAECAISLAVGEEERVCVDFCDDNGVSLVEACLKGDDGIVDHDCCGRNDAAECSIDSVVGEKKSVCVDFCDDNKGGSLDRGGDGSGAMFVEAKEVNGDDMTRRCDSRVMIEDMEEGRGDKTIAFTEEFNGLPASKKSVSVVQLKGELDAGDSRHPFDNKGLCLYSGHDSGVNIAVPQDVNEDNDAYHVSVEFEAQQEENYYYAEKEFSAEASVVGMKEDCNLNNVGSSDANRQAQCAFPPLDNDQGSFTNVSFMQREVVGEVNRGAVLARLESLNLIAEQEALTKSLDSVDVERNHAASVCIDRSHCMGSDVDSKELVEGYWPTLVWSSVPSGPFPARDFQGSYSGAADLASTCNEIDSRGPQSDSERTIQKSASSNAFRRSNPKRAASSRTTQTDITNKNKHSGLPSTGIKIPKSARKRSCLQRTARHSAWGEFASLVQCFKQTDMILRCNGDSTHLQQNKEPHIQNSGTSIRKPQWTQKVRNSRSLRSRNVISTNSKHVKNQKFGASASPSLIESLNIVETISNVSVPVSSDHIGSAMCTKVDETDERVSEEKNEIDAQLLKQDGHQGDRDVESSLTTQDISGDNMLGERPGMSSLVLAESIMNRQLLGPESSPDSIVYNPLMDGSVISSHATTPALQNSELCETTLAPDIIFQDDSHASVLNSHKPSVNPDITFSADLHSQHKKENKCLDFQYAYQLSKQDRIKDSLHDTRSENIKKYVRKENRRKKHHSKQDGHLPSEVIGKGIRKGTMSASLTPPNVTKTGVAELNFCEHRSRLVFSLETSELPQSIACNREPEDKGLLSVTRSIGTNFHCTNKRGLRKGKSHSSASTNKGRQEDFHQPNMGITQKLHKSIMKEATHIRDSFPEPNGGTNILSEPAACLGVDAEPCLSQSAWVQCDECQKWRCISTELADRINETSCRWICTDNSDEAFADCSIPQEKTNKEINLELGVSDDEDTSNVVPNSGIVNSKIEVSHPSCWTPIKTNSYLHRSRRTQSVDEIMVCNCKPPSNGNFGCGDSCLNRVLNIECAKGTCPCGDLCSNQQFQKRKYAKMKQIHCGKKGFGLQLLQDVSGGQFLIEYVGEVLDLATYDARQQYYASRGQKHFYFMTLKGGEVIDACAKGNLGRFINHSCNPNCHTEKWMVNGEVCIGLFALRDIKKGEEVTFDYNYERIFGAAAKKCICGSSGCRGYLGGNPSNCDVIVHGDSDDEYPEPVMAQKDHLKKLQKDNIEFAVVQEATENDEETIMKKKDLIESPNSSTIPESGNSQEILDSISWPPLLFRNPLEVSCERPTLVEHEEIISNVVDDVQISKGSSESLNKALIGESACNPISSTHSEVPSRTCIKSSDPIFDSAHIVTTSKSNRIDAEPSCSQTISSSRHSLKKSKSTARNPISQKNKKVTVSDNSKKVPVVAGSSHDGVERELDGLLNGDGGISRRKGSIKGYLKLLNFTAAVGDNVGRASQSVRELSLILDALLKTRSNRVLDDVVNMNGWQLLHNILKQNRTKFNRTPVVRKLLKVLQDLAEKGILKTEHMDKSPPCNGMESFRDTIWALTKHDDNQVHFMACDFRKRWLPRVFRRVGPSDRDDSQLESDHYQFKWCPSLPSRVQLDQGARNSDAIVCVNKSECQPTSCMVGKPRETSQDPGQLVQSSLPLTDNNCTSLKTVGKRKSRWDQPSEEPNSKTFCFIQDQTLKAGLGAVEANMLQPALGLQPQHTDQSTKANYVGEREDANDSMKCTDDNPPPGFGSSQNDNSTGVPEVKPISTKVVAGYPQKKYVPTLTVSYGMPVTLAQQLGTPEVGDTPTCQNQSWAIAPGMPFHPFPPLPPYPRGNLDISKQMEGPSGHKTRGHVKTRLGKRCHTDSQATDHDLSSAAGEMPTDMVVTKHRHKYVSDRNNDRFPRSDRWSNHRHQNYWPRFRERNNRWHMKDN